MAKKSKKNTDQFKILLAHNILNIVAVLFCMAGLLIFLSLGSYHVSDPSMNTAAGGTDIKNWIGAPGAALADFLIQSAGLAGFALGFVFLAWSRAVYLRVIISFKTVRLLSALAGTIALAVAFAALPNEGKWLPTPTYGGAAGTLIFNALMGGFLFLGNGWAVTISALCGFISGALAIGYACAIPLSTWKRWGLGALSLFVGSLIFAKETIDSAFSWLYYYGTKPLGVEVSKPVKKAKPVAVKPAPVKPPTALVPEPTPPAQEGAFDLPIVQQPKPSTPTTGSLFANKDELGNWALPPLSLLQDVPQEEAYQVDERALQNNAQLLQQVLTDFKVDGDIVKVHPGPVVTLYELEPAPGTKSSRVIGLSDDIARSMAAVSVRAAVVPGRNVIGIELPNKERKTVYLREVFETDTYAKTKAKLPLVLGKDIGGQEVIADLAKMPHLLIAGTTGSGKSVAINTMLLSLLYRLSPEQCRLIMIDPKMLELSVYDDIPHLLTPVVTEPGKAIVALKWLVGEMENRYRAMSKLGVRNIDGYNQKIRDALKKGDMLTRKVQTGFDPETGKPVFEDQPMEMQELPYIVVIVDEFADLMLVAGKEVESAIQRLAQMARAAGIHIVMATQRPSVDVITGVIKANFPTRISFAVTSKIDSRTILGDGGAEQLLGMGDMLYMASGGKIKRVHGPFVADEEVEEIVKHLKSQSEPDYIDIFTDFSAMEGASDIFGDGEESGPVDELYDKAVALIAREQKASTSFIQRYFQIGYNRAARIIEEMEKQGVVGPANHVGKREILVQDHSDADTGT